MLGKLIRHEFRATGRSMLPVLGVMVLLGLLANLSIRLLNTDLGGSFLRVLLVLSIVAFFIFIVAAWIVAIVVMITRFYRNLLDREGYLMFTLPTGAHSLIWSKLIVSTVWFLATALLIVLLAWLTGANLLNLSGENINITVFGLNDLLDALRRLGVRDGSLYLLVAQLVLGVLLSCLTTCLHFYAAMSIGQMAPNRKGLWSVLAFIGISIVFSILGSTVFSGLAHSGSFDAAAQQIEDLARTVPGLVRLANGGMGGSLLLELIQGAVLYAATALCLQKRLNLA